MVYITGDCHADWRRFSTAGFPEQKNMSPEKDYVIVCGDFGIWHDTSEERWWLDWLNDKPFTTLFVDGNHENFDRLCSDEFETVDFHGRKAHKIRNNIYHLMRGYVFDLCGKNFFTFGGAASHDIDDGILNLEDYNTAEDLMQDYKKRTRCGEMLRINHYSWWQEEMPSQAEMNLGTDTLLKYDRKVDFIVSHCCSAKIAKQISWSFQPDPLTAFFNSIEEQTEFNTWFFGHYHDNRNIADRFILLYEQIIRVV